MLEVMLKFFMNRCKKNSGGPVTSRIKHKFFVNSSLIYSACLSYLVTKHSNMFHSFVVFAYTVPSAWKSWNLSQPPTFHLETSYSSSRLQRSYCLDKFFPKPPRYTRWLCLEFPLDFRHGACNFSGSVFVSLHLLVCISLKGKGPIFFIFLVLAPHVPPD